VTENHRVLEALGAYLTRWDVKVGGYQERASVIEAVAELPSPLLAMQVVEEFRGVPGAVAVIARVGSEPRCAVFSWLSRRG